MNDSALFILGAAIHRKSLGASLRRLASKLDDALEYAFNRRLFTALTRIPATKELADEIASVGLPRSKQTVVLIETAEGKTIVAGGGPDLTAAQKALAREKGLLIADDLPGFHAEMTGIVTAGKKGLLPVRGVTTNKMCRDGSASCFNQLSEMARRGGYELKLAPDGRSFEFIKTGGQ